MSFGLWGGSGVKLATHRLNHVMGGRPMAMPRRHWGNMAEKGASERPMTLVPARIRSSKCVKMP